MHSAADLTGNLEQGDGLDFMRFAGMDFDLYTPTPPIGYPSPDSGLRAMLTDDSIEAQQDILANFQLPIDLSEGANWEDG